MDTAEARAEAALRRDATLEAVAFAAQRLLQDPDWESLVPHLLRRLGEATDVSRVYLIENQLSGGRLRTILRGQWLASESLRRMEIGTELGFDGLQRWVTMLGRGDVVAGRPAEFPPSERGPLSDHGIRSILLAPLSVAGGWWGYMGFDDCEEDRVWSQVEIDALRAAVGTLGAAIERERSDRRLRETEARYRDLVEKVAVITYIDAEDATTRTWPTTRYVSPQIETILGYAPGEWLEDPNLWLSVLHPEDREAALAADELHYRTGEPLRSEYRVLAKDGSVVWIRDHATILIDADGTPISQGVLIDITESKRAEEQVREAEARYRDLVEHIPAVTYRESLEADPELFYMSPQVSVLFGYTPEEWTWTPGFWRDHIHPDDRDRVMAINQETNETGEPFKVEYRFRRADGTFAWIQDQATLVGAEHGMRFWQGFMIDVTEHREAEAALAEAEARYRGVVENIPAVTYRESAAPHPDLLYLSPQVADVLGYTVQEWTRTPHFWRDHMHPEDRDRVLEHDRVTDETGEPYAIEYRFRAPDGRYVWVHDQATLVGSEDGEKFWQGFMFDVTERREAETALAEAEARFRTLVEQVPVVIYTQAIDPQDPSVSNTVYIGPRTEELLGYTVEETLETGGLWRDILHPDDRERVLAADAAGNATGETFEMEHRMIAKDGRVVWVHDEATVVRDREGAPRFWQGFMLDITERRRAEERLEDALEVEREAAQRLRSLDEMKNTFLQAVSHDLRTPLAAILGLAVTLERAEIHLPPEETRDLARRIATNARKLDRMVTDLLDLDRLARGIVAPKLHPIDVGALVTRVVEDSDLMELGRVALDAPEVVVSVDAAKVERIVENLLANTLRHTPAGTPVSVRVAPEGDGVLIVVEDQGSGVPEEIRETIFEPFRQGPDAPEHSPGVGVGLTLVRRFAELHGGRAWAQGREGGGASFRIFLPNGSND